MNLINLADNNINIYLKEFCHICIILILVNELFIQSNIITYDFF